MNAKAKEQLAVDNIRFPRYIVHKFYNNFVNTRNYDELESAAMFGLAKAIDKFDESKGIKFITFAGVCIHNEIKMLLRKWKKQHGKTIPLEGALSTDQFGNVFTILNILSTDKDLIYSDDEFNTLKEIDDNQENYLTFKERVIFKVIKKDITQSEASKQLKLSQSYVSRLSDKLKEKLIKMLESENI